VFDDSGFTGRAPKRRAAVARHPKRALTVVMERTPPFFRDVHYRIITAKNMTLPKVGDCVEPDRLERLIRDGVDVSIRAAKPDKNDDIVALWAKLNAED
jgi:hypothetical protein